MEVTFSPMMFFLFLGKNYQDGVLTLPWAIYSFFLMIVIGAILGTVLWFAVTLPRMKK